MGLSVNAKRQKFPAAPRFEPQPLTISTCALPSRLKSPVKNFRPPELLSLIFAHAERKGKSPA